MGFLGFLSRNLLAAVIGGLGILLAALGYWDQATDWWPRAQAWQLQASGAALFVIAVLKILYDFENGLPHATAPGKPSKEMAILKVAASACGTAGQALGWGDQDYMLKAVPVVDAAIAAVTKHFRLARPALPDDPAEAVKVGADYLTSVGPYLRAGQKDDAVRCALAFVQKHGRYEIDLR